MRYSFRQGEILDYEMTQKPVKGEEGFYTDPETTWKYQFSVDSVYGDSYRLTMKFKGYFSGNMWVSDKTSGQEIQKNPSGKRPNLFHTLYNIDINHPVSFTMRSNGEILDITGPDSILAAIILEADRTPDMKRLLEYNQIKTRYGNDFYKWLIQEFFPAIPASLTDTVRLNSGKNQVSRINNWTSVIQVPDSRQPIKLSRAYQFKTDYPYASDFPKRDRVGEMVLTWSPSTGYPTRIKFTGYYPDYLSHFVSISGTLIYYNLSDIEIVNTSRSDNRSEKVVITGTISDLGENSLVAYLPGNRISKTKMPVKPNPDGTFSFQFDFDLPDGLVDLFYYSGSEGMLWRSPGNPNQIRIFVKPGDSVDFSVSLNDPKKIDFRCRTKNDQIALNQLSNKFTPWNPQQSMQTTKDNIIFLENRSTILSPEFSRFMEIENRYTLLSHQVEEFSRSGFGAGLNPIDSLPGFVKHLGFSDGYKSEAYQEFICDLVQSYGSSKILRIFGYKAGTNDFDISTMILRGWDIYWYKAIQAEQRLNKFPNEDYDQLYIRFSEEYPGSEYQNQLYLKYKTTEKARVGTGIPDLKFVDLAGKKWSTRNFKGHPWVLINSPYEVMDYKSIDSVFKPLIEKYLKNGKVIIAFPVFKEGDIKHLANELKGISNIIVRDPSGKDDFGKYMEQLPALQFGIDQNNRIIAYLEDHWMEMSIFSSWPESKTLSPGTINLTVFWYSLASAFVLAVIIILTIRIRAKRREARLNLKRRMAQLEVDAVRSRMNPHFLFNALSSIQNLINRKQIEEANLYLARFGDLVRTILSQSSKPAIGLNEEIDMIRNYLQLEQLRFPFTFDIQVAGDVDTFAIEVPPLLIQPHVENAVMHGVSGLGAAGRIAVVFRNEEHHLVCEIKDNGPGYHPETKTGNGGLGQGWKLTRQRIELMKEQYGEDVSVEVTNGIPAGEAVSEYTGTTVIFRLPIQQTTL